MDIHASIKHIYPNAKFSVNNNDYKQILWLSNDLEKPSLNEISLAWDELQEKRNKDAYISARRSEYPPIGDQLDVIWKELEVNKSLTQDSINMLEKINNVKKKHPKT